MLLDDCLSELDQSRQQHVLELVSQFEQILLTTAAEPPGQAQGEVFRLHG